MKRRTEEEIVDLRKLVIHAFDEIILDGGVRRGTDIVKALALGAKACMIGRPFLYGLASRGGPGVALALQILRNELDLALALTGCARAAQLDASFIGWAD